MIHSVAERLTNMGELLQIRKKVIESLSSNAKESLYECSKEQPFLYIKLKSGNTLLLVLYRYL